MIDLRGNNLTKGQIDELRETLSDCTIFYTEFGELMPTTSPFPEYDIVQGQQGDNVLLMQQYLNAIRSIEPDIPQLSEDGSFGPATQNAVQIFQKLYGLSDNGIIGQETWDKIVEIYNSFQ